MILKFLLLCPGYYLLGGNGVRDTYTMATEKANANIKQEAQC
jgi:hypothetical protein